MTEATMKKSGKPYLAGRETAETATPITTAATTVATKAEPDNKKPLPKQQKLPQAQETPSQPQAVRNGMMLAGLLKPKQKKEKDERYLGLEISVRLTEDHKGHLPKAVQKQWDNIKGGDIKDIGILGIPVQSIELRVDPKQKEPDFFCDTMWLENVELAVIEETGSGESTEIVRFRFTAWMELAMDELKWVSKHYDNDFWMSMKNVQGELKLG